MLGPSLMRFIGGLGVSFYATYGFTKCASVRDTWSLIGNYAIGKLKLFLIHVISLVHPLSRKCMLQFIHRNFTIVILWSRTALYAVHF